jgi:hypothetical protein
MRQKCLCEVITTRKLSILVALSSGDIAISKIILDSAPATEGAFYEREKATF